MIVPFLAPLAEEVDLALLQLQLGWHVNQPGSEFCPRRHKNSLGLEEKGLGMGTGADYLQGGLLLVLEPDELFVPGAQLCLEGVELELWHLAHLYPQQVGQLAQFPAVEHHR